MRCWRWWSGPRRADCGRWWGGPIASSLPAEELKADHVVIGEAEELIASLAQDLESGTAKAVYQAAERPQMSLSPLRT